MQELSGQELHLCSGLPRSAGDSTKGSFASDNMRWASNVVRVERHSRVSHDKEQVSFAPNEVGAPCVLRERALIA